MENPKCKQKGYTREFFDFVNNRPALQIGGVLLTNCPVPIQVAGRPLFSIEAPTQSQEPFLLSGIFTDVRGKPTLVIENNEWRATTWSWDVEVVGNSITIREKLGKVQLVLKAVPPHTLVVEKLDMMLAGRKIYANKDCLKVEHPQGPSVTLVDCFMDNSRVGISL